MKILVISNNSIVHENSNGRTLLNLLSSFEKNEIFNFYISGRCPVPDSCSHFFQLTDKAAFLSIFFLRSQRSKRQKSSFQKSKKRTAFRMMVRDTIWRLGHWKSAALIEIKKFSPDVILLQMGDFPYIINFGRKLSIKLAKPLLTYNSENYLFKDFDFFNKTLSSNVLYFLYHIILSYAIKKTFLRSKANIYLTPFLKKQYDRFAPWSKGFVIYNSSDITEKSQHDCSLCEMELLKVRKTFVYGGNLSSGRDEALVKIASFLADIDRDARLIVFGTASEKQIVAFSKTSNIIYKGFVSYAELIEFERKSYCIVHVEGFGDYYEKDLVDAFSSKIPDCLALGKPLLVFGPKGCADVRYLKMNNFGFCATNENELKKELDILCLQNLDFLKIKENAKELLKKNHDLIKNSQNFQDIIISVNQSLH